MKRIFFKFDSVDLMKHYFFLNLCLFWAVNCQQECAQKMTQRCGSDDVICMAIVPGICQEGDCENFCSNGI